MSEWRKENGILVWLQSHVWFRFKEPLSSPSGPPFSLGMNQSSLSTGVLKGVWTCFLEADKWQKLLSGPYFGIDDIRGEAPAISHHLCVQNDSAPDSRHGDSDSGPVTEQHLKPLCLEIPLSCLLPGNTHWASPRFLVLLLWVRDYGLALAFCCYGNRSWLTAEQWCSKPWWELVRALINCDPPKIIIKLPIKTHQRESSLWALGTPGFLAILFPFYGIPVLYGMLGIRHPSIHPSMFISWRVPSLSD